MFYWASHGKTNEVNFVHYDNNFIIIMYIIIFYNILFTIHSSQKLDMSETRSWSLTYSVLLPDDLEDLCRRSHYAIGTS